MMRVWHGTRTSRRTLGGRQTGIRAFYTDILDFCARVLAIEQDTIR